jgi:hypothetical protein
VKVTYNVEAIEDAGSELDKLILALDNQKGVSFRAQ